MFGPFQHKPSCDSMISFRSLLSLLELNHLQSFGNHTGLLITQMFNINTFLEIPLFLCLIFALLVTDSNYQPRPGVVP